MLLTLTALFCLAISYSNAQTNNPESYVVTVRNDTTPGQIRSISLLQGNELVSFRDENNQKKQYTPNQIKAFKYGDKGVYHSVHLVNRYVFMKVIESGYLSAYEYSSISRQSNTNEVENYLKMNMGEVVLVPKIGFRKKIAPMLEACPTVYQKVENKDLDFTDLKEIAKGYNLCQANKPQVAVSTTVARSTPTVVEVTPDQQSTEISSLISYLQANPQTHNSEELIACLNDIYTKRKTGANVPKYLLDALVSLSKPTASIHEKALPIATALGYKEAGN